MKSFKASILAAAWIICSSAFSQGIDFIPPTPSNVASQIDYQYNPNTGTADIQIPLFGLAAGDYHYPVALNYNTSGIRVSDIASCVGLGWELMAEGSISRVVRGIPDDQDDNLGHGWLYITSSDVMNFPINGNEDVRAFWIDGVLSGQNGELDTEPDLFFLTLPGITCSFVFGNETDGPQTREILLIPYQNIKINYSLDSFGHLDEFIVTDPSGNTYHLNVPVKIRSSVRTVLDPIFMTNWSPYVNFGSGQDRIFKIVANPYHFGGSRYGLGGSPNIHIYKNTVQVDPSQTLHETTTYEWKLSEVVTPFQETLSFSYADEEVPLDEDSYKVYQKYNCSGYPDTVLAHQVLNEAAQGFTPATLNKRLTAMESATGKIEFIYDTQDRQDLIGSKKLNSIKAYSKQGTSLSLVCEYELTHSYFQSCSSVRYINSNNGDKRLKLETLTLKNGLNSYPPFEFSYEYTYPLPSRYSYAQDIWGYYNGKTTNHSFIPNVYVYPGRTGNDRFRYYPVTSPVAGRGFDDEIVLDAYDRLPDEVYMTSGSLVSIKVPTGQYMSFEYEPHQFKYFSEDDQTIYSGGGLRLTQMNFITSETYHYEIFQTQNPTGQVLALPSYGYFDPESWPEDPEDRNQEYFKINYVRVNQNLTNFLEGSIMYNEVYIQDGFEGSKVLKFNNGPALGEGNDSDYPWYRTTDIDYCRALLDIPDGYPSLGGLSFGKNEFPFPANPPYAWNRGLMKQKLDYNSDNEIVAKTSYHYKVFLPSGQAPDSVCGMQIGFLQNTAQSGLTQPLEVYGKYPVYGNMSMVLDTSKAIIYDQSDGDSIVTVTTYGYNDFAQLKEIMISNSNGDKLITKTKYVPDYWNTPQTPSTSDPMAEALISFFNKNILDLPVESLQLLIKDGSQDQYVTGGALTTFRFFETDNTPTPVPLPDGQYVLNMENPILLANLTDSRIENLTFIKDSRYEQKLAYDSYTLTGMLIQSHVNHGSYTANIAGYGGQMVIATCSNALASECGYTGFEMGESNGWEGIGNEPEIITTALAKSGSYVFAPGYLSGVQQNFNIEDGLASQTGYTATVWAKGNSSAILKMSINGSDNVKTAVSTSSDTWNLLEVTLTKEEIEQYQGTINFIQVYAGNTGFNYPWFDDIRFYPSDAFMSTACYNSWYLPSAGADTRNRYTYSEYDPFGLPLRTRDHDGNILSEYQYTCTALSRKIKTIILKTEEYDPNHLDQLTPFQKTELFQYFDGYGRLVQSVGKQQSYSMKDIVSFNTFDSYGRPDKLHLPFASDYDDGRYITNPVGDQLDFYHYEPDVSHTAYPYSVLGYDHSPLNMTNETGYPGHSWQPSEGHTSVSSYGLNEANEIIRFNYNSSTYACFTITGKEYYPEDSLIYFKYTDENDHFSKTFKDKSGRLICTVSLKDGLAEYSYNIYDDFGRLVYIIPPQAFNQMQSTSDYSFSPSDQIAESYIFSYRYDAKGRLIFKKVPGSKRVAIVYDNLDRPIMAQDGNHYGSNKWDFISYDVHGRTAITGIYTAQQQLTQQQMQQAADAHYSDPSHRNYETFVCASCTSQYINGYTHLSFPLHTVPSCEVMTVNYYDSYAWDFDDSYPFIPDLAVNTENISGKLSAQKIRILNDASPEEWLFNVFFYDEKGRLIENIRDNHSGGSDIILAELDFLGKPVRNWQYHNLDETSIREYITQEYDHADRPTTMWYSIDDESSSFILNKNMFNQLGQLIECNIHSLDEEHFLQSVDFKYNPRGWLTNINQSNLDNSHYFINLDQFMAPDETVGGIRIDSLQLSIDETEPDVIDLDFNDDKDLLIIDKDTTSIARFQPVDEHTLNQVRVGTIDSLTFESLRDLSGRVLIFLFHDVFFSPADELKMVSDSLSYLVRQQIEQAGITDTVTIDAVESQVVDQILKSISIIYFNEDTDDLFGEDILYDIGFPELDALSQYNGNISGIKWQTTENSGIRGYGFAYDQLNQLLGAKYAELDGRTWTGNADRYNVFGIEYDHNGNILSLERNGLTGTLGETSLFGQMDELTYTYDGNQLKAVQDGIVNSGSFNNDFKDNGSYETTEYEYDFNGNLVSDYNKGIVSITYNHLNLPEEIVFSPTRKITYLYTADGEKLSETITDGQMTRTYDYCSNLVYEDGELSYILTPAGRALPGAEPREYAMEYFLADHLGNIRVVFGDADRDNVAEVIQENHYYPFGMTMGGLNFNAGLENRYLYQGKEITGDLNLWWHDFHARRFDSQLGRWHVPDPAGQWVNPYLGMGNNPVSVYDPDGRRDKKRTRRQGSHPVTEWVSFDWDFSFLMEIFTGSTPLSNFSITYGSAAMISDESGRIGGGGNPLPGGSVGGGRGLGNGWLADGDRDSPFRMQPITKPRVDERKIYRDALQPLYRNDLAGQGVNYNDLYAGAVEKLAGKPYVLGADGPKAYDCSSTACYGIRTVANSKFGDYTSHDLYTKFSVPSSSKTKGTVIFYDFTSDGRIDHITTILNSSNMLHPSSGAGVLQIKPINYLDSYTNKRGGTIYYREFNWLIINKTP